VHYSSNFARYNPGRETERLGDVDAAGVLWQVFFFESIVAGFTAMASVFSHFSTLNVPIALCLSFCLCLSTSVRWCLGHVTSYSQSRDS
jgi:hypothetical protein